MYCKQGTRIFSLWFISCLFFSRIFAQFPVDSISEEYVEKTINFLASNKMKGRVNYTPEQLDAAEFLAAEFKKSGLVPFPGFADFYIPFRTKLALDDPAKLEWNDHKIKDSLYYFISSGLKPARAVLDEFIILQAGFPLADSLLFFNWKNTTNKVLIWLNLPPGISFSEATRSLVIPDGMPYTDILIVAAPDEPTSLRFSVGKNTALYNIVGMLPGDSLANEAIVFSAHYDHIDRGISGETVEIFNGANDDASGTTAVLALAHYFSEQKNNRRTILFCLFAGEELGLLGSSAFVNLITPESIKAVLNIEMIGITNASGKNAFMVTGSEYSNLADILQSNLRNEKTRVKKLYAEPTHLFERSDNYSFALKGIPSHTLMCSDDKDPCYHMPCDDVRRIDMKNMTTVIRAIAKSARTLIEGIDTPKRITR